MKVEKTAMQEKMRVEEDDGDECGEDVDAREDAPRRRRRG
jgi:hypothetical protein